MAVFDLFRKTERPVRRAARQLYAATVDQSRAVGFYVDLGVPDTVDGRLDVLFLHAYLVLRRLRRDGEASAELAQDYFDLMFEDIDSNLRQVGVSDIMMARRIKKLAACFYGRIAAYDAAQDAADADALGAALQRNVYQTVDAPAGALDRLGAYIRREDANLAGQPPTEFMAGNVVFGAAPDLEEAS